MKGSTLCAHCAVLPKRLDNHTVVALCDDGTPERAWFFTYSIQHVKKFAGTLVPHDGAFGDWEHRMHDGTELMVLTANDTRYIWKLTDRYDNEQRFGVWAD
jgi:hypothetical protein